MGTISAKGVCWSTSINPTISDSKTVEGTGDADFTSTLIGLLSNTTYHIRSYVTNETGTTYGADVEFTTPKYTQFKSGTKVFVINGKVLVIE